MPEPRSRAFRWRGWFGIAILLPAAVLTLLSPPVIIEETAADVLTDLLAWGLFMTGAVLRLWGTLYLGGRKGNAVVTDGPYSLCRNPLYLGSFCLAASLPLFLKSITLAVGLVVTAALYASYTIPAEERYLRERLGDPYRAYCARTSRFWLRLSAFETPELIEVNVPALHREAKKARGWAFLPVAAELLAHLRQASWWPHLFR